MKVCPACNTINPDNTTFCVRCGTRCVQVYAIPTQKDGLTLVSDGSSLLMDRPAPASGGFAVASFVIGMVSFPLACLNIFLFIMLPFTCLAGVTGLVFGLVSIRRKISGMAIAGIVLNILAILCSIALIIIFVLILYAIYSSGSLHTLPDLATKI